MQRTILANDGKELIISNVTDWRSVEHIPSGGSIAEKQINDKYGLSGVYQFCHINDMEEIGDELIHPLIGYIGQSKDIVSRTYTVRAPKGNHGVNRIIKQRDWDRGSVYVRWIFCELPVELERYLHAEMISKHGYSFAWREASDGNDGLYSRALDSLDGLTYDELCDIISQAKIKAREVKIEEIDRELGAL